MFSLLADQDSIDEMSYKYLLIQMNDPQDVSAVDTLSDELNRVLPDKVSIQKVYLDRKVTEKVHVIVDLVFNVTISIMMFLCFFSLVASMSSNLFQ